MYTGAETSIGSTQPQRAYQNTPEPVRSVGHVGEQGEEAMRLAQTLHQELEALEVRIGGILRPCPPSGSPGADKANRPVMSVHAEHLTSVNAALHAAVGRVRDLAARADL